MLSQTALGLKGEKRINRDYRCMPVLQALYKEWLTEKPLEGVRVVACLHITTETAVLMRVLKIGGAEVRLCASNPLSTMDDVVAALRDVDGIEVVAKRGDSRDDYYEAMNRCLEVGPDVLIDDGCDLIAKVHDMKQLREKIWGATEETTTGVNRLKQMERVGNLRFPIIAVNDSRTKYLFDNRYGTGQSTLDAILRATNRLIAGTTFLVCGYGMCGKGVAARASGLGANVVVAEVDPVRALEAVMDGYRVMKVIDAVKEADFIVSVTGNTTVIGEDCFDVMKDGAVIANSGHFDVEIDVDALKRVARSETEITPVVHDYVLPSGKVVTLLGQGRLANLSVAEGHPAQIMDMSFANQALAVKWLVDRHKSGTRLENRVHILPDAVDRMVADIRLKSVGVEYDCMTDEQAEYMKSWRQGT